MPATSENRSGKETLVWSTCNPEGLGDDYSGVYLRKADIASMVAQVQEANAKGEVIPVHIEHKGVAVGRVVSAWEHADTMQCVLAIDNRVVEGALGTEFIRSGLIKDVSLGYSVDLKYSRAERKLNVNNKRLREISLVKRGARKKCHIHGYTS